MLWQMTSNVPLTQCYQGEAKQSVAPVYLYCWKKGVTPGAAAGFADTQDFKQSGQIRKLLYELLYINKTLSVCLLSVQRQCF